MHFLPYSHPQYWLPALFQVWDGVNTGVYDEQMLDLLAQLSVTHLNPKVSNPKRLETIPKTALNIGSEGEDAFEGDEFDVDDDPEEEDNAPEDGSWRGIRKEIGILTEKEFQMVMTKCLRSMGTPVGGPGAKALAGALAPMDSFASKNILAMKKPTSRLLALSEIIVYSMAEDEQPKADSSFATPRAATPINPALKRVKGESNGMHHSGSSDSLADAGRRAEATKSYLGGSKALEQLSKLIVSCETFFHPSNHGAWTKILATFVKDLAWQFLKRWKEEENPKCKTPMEWRLTAAIRREFVLTLRTVALMSIFAKDQTSLNASRECLKSLVVLEPELIIPSVIERAIPSLTNLEETARTTAVIKTLTSVSWAMVSHHVSTSALQHIPSILELTLAGIDMNDPGKTLATVIFMMNILQYIRLEELPEEVPDDLVAGPRNPEPRTDLAIDVGEDVEDRPSFTPEEQNTIFRQATMGFPAWISDFIDRVFRMYDNMPEENERSLKAGVSSEERILTTVNSLVESITVNLSQASQKRVIDQIFDHVTTTVRSNSLRVVNGLILSISNTCTVYVLEKFVPYCIQRIRNEISHGAGTKRTTTTTVPVPSDATLHWFLALLLGAVSGAAAELLPWKKDLLSLFEFLTRHTLSEASWSWTGRMMDKVIVNMTSVYPMEGRMVNEDVWDSDGQYERFTRGLPTCSDEVLSYRLQV